MKKLVIKVMVFDYFYSKLYKGENSKELLQDADLYVKQLLKSECLQPEEKAYLTDDRNKDEIRKLYLQVRNLMIEPVDKTYKDTCLLGYFLDFDDVFATEIFTRAMQYSENRYAMHDLNLVNGKYNDTDSMYADYINRTMYKYDTPTAQCRDAVKTTFKKNKIKNK